MTHNMKKVEIPADLLTNSRYGFSTNLSRKMGQMVTMLKSKHINSIKNKHESLIMIQTIF